MSSRWTGESTPLLVVQMHGEPGSGKTALARALAPAIPAIHLDKDVISSALIRAGIAPELQGPGAYESLREVARSLMAQGHSVILDSPCFWPLNEEKGRALAADFGATWAMVECRCPGDVVEHRLATRERLESHPLRRGAGAERPGMYEPTCERLTLDSTRPVAELVVEAVRYLRGPRVPVDEMREFRTAHVSKRRPRATTSDGNCTVAPPLPQGRERGPGGEGGTPGSSPSPQAIRRSASGDFHDSELAQ